MSGWFELIITRKRFYLQVDDSISETNKGSRILNKTDQQLKNTTLHSLFDVFLVRIYH